jgi:hypothetical protein
MNRRSFLQFAVGGMATAALARSFPFRAFSFPSRIVIPPIGEYTDYLVMPFEIPSWSPMVPLTGRVIMMHPDDLARWRTFRDEVDRRLGGPDSIEVRESEHCRRGHPLEIPKSFFFRDAQARQRRFGYGAKA